MAKANNQDFVTHIADINVDFPSWYTDVIIQSQMVDYGPVKGTMVIRPYGYAIWERIQEELDKRIKATGHKNAYFPMLIPKSFLAKEAEHMEGFAPEVAWVTMGGGQELAEPLFIRPTSETIICSMYSKWVQSYRDLPVLINQWANVMRWEKSTRPFLRTSEFLWQEGHTCHASEEEAQKETIKMLGVYDEVCRDIMALPMITGRKSEKEKFAGAQATYTIEAMMQDGKALQSGTSHNLGQHFSKMFDIKYQSREGREEYVWQTSWGVSTRLIGAIVMVHGDQRGLVLPPQVAPIEVVVIPIAMHKEGVIEKCTEVYEKLKALGIRAELDDRDTVSPGYKFNEYELKGVPLRLEIGPRDIENGVATAMRRDTLEKFTLPLEGIETETQKTLEQIQNAMYEKAKRFVSEHISEAHDMKEFAQGVDKGYVKAMWCGERACEDAIKEETGATSRCMPFEQKPIGHTCVHCGKSADKVVMWARAY